MSPIASSYKEWEEYLKENNSNNFHLPQAFSWAQQVALNALCVIFDKKAVSIRKSEPSSEYELVERLKPTYRMTLNQEGLVDMIKCLLCAPERWQTHNVGYGVLHIDTEAVSVQVQREIYDWLNQEDRRHNFQLPKEEPHD